jgi:hypothetical protein
MKRIQGLVGHELVWVQPNMLKHEFELQDGGERVATLDFRSSFGSFATACTAEGSWTFKRVGFWKPNLTIRTANTDTQIAVFHNNTWKAGGSLEMADGRRYRASSNLWMTTYDFKNEKEEVLVRFTRIRGVVHFSCKVEIEPAGAKLTELPWLVAFGWYLVVKMQDESSGAAAAAAAG